MILTCPACGTQYVVKDGAIPAGGRQVRCASCRHSWHQDPESADIQQPPAGEAPEGLAAGIDVASDSPADDAAVEPVSADAEPTMLDEAASGASDTEINSDIGAPVTATATEADVDDDFTPFMASEAAHARRRGPAVGVLIAILVIVLAALAFWYLAPAEWRARIGIAEASATPLQLMMTHSDRQRLESGNELLAISGRVINPTQDKQSVPPITAQLRDGKGKLVYSWTIAPPAPSLKGGESAPFYSAEVNVPAGGDELTVTLGAPKG